MLPKTSSCTGFTLLEVLISLAMMAIAMMSLWGLHITSYKVDARGDMEARAHNYCNDSLELLRFLASTNFSDLRLTTAVTIDNPEPATPTQRFTRTVTITPMSTWRRDALVNVTWQERVRTSTGQSNTVTRSVRLNTILTDLSGT